MLYSTPRSFESHICYGSVCLCLAAAVPLLDTPIYRSLTALGPILCSTLCSFESHICYGSVPLENAADKTIGEYYFGGDGPQ